MELFELLVNLSCCVLELINAGVVAADGVAWKRSRGNRQERRAARKAGETPPPPTGWTTAFWVLTPIVVVLTVILAVKWLRVAARS